MRRGWPGRREFWLKLEPEIGRAGPAALERRLFRDGMSRVASAVHIVATDGPAGLSGITANSVCSVSDEPATLLVCVSRASLTAPRLLANGVFCVNALAARDRELADCFAGRTGLHLEDRFRQGEWLRLATGAPMLASAVAVFDCRIVGTSEVATHHVIFGEVVDMRLRRAEPCLAYHDRAYVTLGAG